MILAGDIGGTKTQLALFEKKSGKMLCEKKYPSKEYASLSRILKEFLDEFPASLDRVCVGIAGPIQKGKCTATNLSWIVDAKDVARVVHTKKIFLINDLAAMGYGISALKREELFVLQEGKPVKNGVRALIAAGTGLGVAGLVWTGAHYAHIASEGGHADFAGRNEEELKLWSYLNKKFGRVSYERVLSGEGLTQLYHYLLESRKEKEPEWLKKAKEPARAICEMAIKKKDHTSRSALDWFVSLYGSEAGNVALQFLPTGGLYIGGGIAPHILEVMKSPLFMESFLNKGRLSSYLSQIPVKVILNEKTPLLGACYYARYLV